MNIQVIRGLLVFFLAVIFIASVFFLSHRKMSAWAYVFWGIFALLLPAFGPFFVIAYGPGERRRGVRGYKNRKAAKRFRNSELT